MGARTDTKGRMVSSAALLLREHGVAGTSVTRVLEHSKGPRGSVQFHFPGGRLQLLTDAVVRAGGLVTALLHRAREEGARPGDVLTAICDHYAQQLVVTDFRAGCPVGAVAQEAYGDPVLGPTVAHVLDDWAHALAAVLVDAGHDAAEASELAWLCIGAVEGAITLARVRRSTRPLELVRERLTPLLAPTRPASPPRP